MKAFKCCVLGAGIVFSLLGDEASATYLWPGSLLDSMVHDGGFGTSNNTWGPEVQWTLNPNPTIQFDSQITGAGDDVSHGKGGIGFSSGEDFAGVWLAPETGVSQYAPTGDHTPASLRIDFTSLFFPADEWKNLIGQVHMNLSGYASSVGAVEVIANVRFTAVDNWFQGAGHTGRTTIWDRSLVMDWTNTEIGPISTSLSNSMLLPDYPRLDYSVHDPDFYIQGYFEFRAKNDNGLSELTVPDGISLSSVPEPSTVVSLMVASLAAIFFRLVQGFAGRRT